MAHPHHTRLPLAMLGIWLAACGIAQSQEAVPELQNKLDRLKQSLQRGEKLTEPPPANPPIGPIQPLVPFPHPVPAPLPSQKKTASLAPAIQPIEATPEQIAGWIRDLDAVEFDTRETATLSLVASGSAVLPSLRPALAKSSLEATSRALFVIRQLGLATNLDVQDDAGQLLNELAEQTASPALARRAAATLADLTLQRSTQAVAALEDLGAKISRVQLDVNNPLDERVDAIEIGEKFRGDESDLRRLKWIVEVRLLLLMDKQVTDEWIERAVAMPGLEELHLHSAKISDAGLATLKDHPSLRAVGIYHTPINDAALQPLLKLPLLAHVKLYGTRISKEGAEQFKTASGLNVDFRRGAFLGVGGQEMERGCYITTVHPGSPAEKAGILPYDTIVRFGGAEVKSFNKLTELIAPREFGEEVEVEVLRPVLDGQIPFRTITTKVTLAGWEANTAVQNRPR